MVNWACKIVAITLASTFGQIVSAAFLPRNGIERSLASRAQLLGSRAAAVTPKIYGFQQQINHFPNNTYYGPTPPNATFTQRYILNDTFYKPGGPIIMLNSGETSATSRFSYVLTGVIGELAEATHGLSVILEHRYYGSSFPVRDLTTDNLRWLTTEQSIADIAYFAQHVTFPGYENKTLTAPATPWIIYGGSLAGAETAYTLKEYGHVIYGGISSSGTVRNVIGYPEWYYNVQKYAPQDCVKTIEDIVDKVDHVINSKNEKAIAQLKDIFGLATLKDIRDFAITIAFPIGNPYDYPTDSWQEINWDPAIQAQGGDSFSLFCSSVTNKTSPANITAVDHVLSNYTNGQSWKNLGNYASYIKTQIVPLCPKGVSLDSNDCFGTHNASYYTDTSLNGGRSYLYQSCLELGAYSQGAPSGRRSLLSRVVQPDYTQRWCGWSFPKGNYSSVPVAAPHLERVNKYGALKLQADRLAQVDGGQDPWLYNCVHSPEGQGRKDSLLRPYYLIAEGGHHWDENGLGDISKEPAFIQKIHNYEIKFVKSWLADFKSWKR